MVTSRGARLGMVQTRRGTSPTVGNPARQHSKPTKYRQIILAADETVITTLAIPILRRSLVRSLTGKR